MLLVPEGAFPVQGNNSNLITRIHLKECIIDQEGLIQRIRLLIGTGILLPNTVPLSSLCDLRLKLFFFFTSPFVGGQWARGVCRVLEPLSVVTSIRIYVQVSVNCHNKTSGYMLVTASGSSGFSRWGSEKQFKLFPFKKNKHGFCVISGYFSGPTGMPRSLALRLHP